MSDGRSYPTRPILAASIAVFRNGKVLLAARTKPPGPALFSLPGGLVEVGETLQEAALRELDEEVAVRAEIIGFAGHVEVIQRDATGAVERHFVVSAFAARWASGEPQTGPEAQAVIFIDPAEIGTLKTTPGLGPIVERARELVEGAA